MVSFQGELYQVIGIGEGRTIHLRRVGVERCSTCGCLPEVTVLEHSPLFQEGAAPVPTVVE